MCVHHLAQSFQPAFVGIGMEQHIVRAIASGVHDFGRTESLTHDDVAAIGLREPDSQLRPVEFGERLEGEEVDELGRVVVQIADGVLAERLAASAEFDQTGLEA